MENNLETSITRSPHAILDVKSRQLKAQKIEMLLNFFEEQKNYKLLEVGVGGGGIAHYFATHKKFKIDVDAVDVTDNRIVKEGYRFQQVNGCSLPYESNSFDVVISNHVIEHVGSKQEQLEHLSEIKRVVKAAGYIYLAVPNRWMLVEPHYKLIFLSWIPRRYRSQYLRWAKGMNFYDCEPLERNELDIMLKSTGFHYENICIRALKATYFIEQPNSLIGRFFCSIPNFIFIPFVSLIPTLIYRLVKIDNKAVGK